MNEKGNMAEENILWVNEYHQTVVSPQETEEMAPIIADFVKDAGEAGEGAALQSCLEEKMKSYLSEKTDWEIKKIAEDIIRTVNIMEEKRKTLEWYKREGATRERWILKELTRSSSTMTEQQSAEYCKAFATAIKDAGGKMLQTVIAGWGKKAQDGRSVPDNNRNAPDIKEAAKEIAGETVKIGCMGAKIVTEAAVVEEIVSNKEIEPSRAAEAAVKGGADASVKAALAGALKVGAEKNIIKVIPMGTPAAAFAAGAAVAVENAQNLYQAATEKIPPSEAVEKMIDTTASTAVGIAASVKGAEIGAAIGTTLGPEGTAVSAVAGGLIGGIAGSAVGKVIVNADEKVINVVENVLKTVLEG